MDEEFGSFVVTDPDLVDPNIDVSGLRTQTDVSPYLLGNIPDYAGIQYEAFNPSRLSDLMRLYSSGLPAIDTAQIPGAIDTLVDTGDGGQATTPEISEDQRLIDAGIGVQTEPGTVVAPGEMPVTQAEMDAFNQIPVTQPVTGGITGDPILMENIGSPDLGSATEPVLNFGEFAEFGPVTMGGAPVVSQQLQDQGPTTIEGPLSQVQVDGGLSAIDEERLAGYTPSFDTSGLTDATPEQRNTIQNILAAAGDNVQGALTELGKIPGAVVDFANQTVDFFGKKLNVGKTLASIAFNKIAGGPVSLLFDILPQDSLENRTTRSIVDELKAEKDYGFNIQSGNLNQDPFGRNPVSQFGDYEQTLKNDILGVDQSGFQTAEMREKKKEFAQDYFDKKAEKAGGVEVDEGTVLGPGEAPGDLVSLEDLQAEKDAEIAAQNELAKLTGDVDTFDTTPAANFDADTFDDDTATDGGDFPTVMTPGVNYLDPSDFSKIEFGGTVLEDEFDSTPVDEFSDEAFMVGDTSTAAPTTGGSGVDSFFDSVDTITGGGGGRDRDPDPSPSFDPGQGFVDQGGEGEFGSAPSKPTTGTTKPGTDGGGGGDPGGGPKGCVIATHAVNSGAFTKDTKREAVRWCVKNLHRTWWGEAIRRGYRYYGQKAIEEGKAKNHYQEFKDYVAFGTGKRRTLKTGWTFVYRSIQFFIRGLINGQKISITKNRGS